MSARGDPGGFQADLTFLSRHSVQLVLDRLQFVRDLVEMSLLVFQLFPQLLVFPLLSLSDLVGCLRIDQISADAAYPI